MKHLLLERRRINFGTYHEEVKHPHVDALRWYELPRSIKVRGELPGNLDRLIIPKAWDPTFVAVTDGFSPEWDQLVQALKEFDEIAVDMEAHNAETYHSKLYSFDMCAAGRQINSIN